MRVKALGGHCPLPCFYIILLCLYTIYLLLHILILDTANVVVLLHNSLVPSYRGLLVPPPPQSYCLVGFSDYLQGVIPTQYVCFAVYSTYNLGTYLNVATRCLNLNYSDFCPQPKAKSSILVGGYYLILCQKI